MLPVQQISKSQPWPTQQLIESDVEIMQGHFGGQAGPKATQVMGPLPVQTEGVVKLP